MDRGLMMEEPPMYNHIVLIGRLGRDPETRTTPNGTDVATFSMATDRTWKNKETGEKQSETSWHNVVCWAGLANVVSKYLQKGQLVMVAGRSHTRSWDGDDGKKHYMNEVVCQDMKMLGGGKDQGGAQPDSEPGPTDDDIPF